jgi:hypothetical protein
MSVDRAEVVSLESLDLLERIPNGSANADEVRTFVLSVSPTFKGAHADAPAFAQFCLRKVSGHGRSPLVPGCLQETPE